MVFSTAICYFHAASSTCIAPPPSTHPAIDNVVGQYYFDLVWIDPRRIKSLGITIRKLLYHSIGILEILSLLSAIPYKGI